ncbi:N-acetyltransferase [Litoribacter alkaliphilus]|uniref:N-acetyltransferase n=1 Tax=Litoribacter ruber TaxID=702568 RepID=A0AAP2CHL1_9BACT|nr:N-acetyltransferase [Litoribacter alkaliphilus]MBS9524851.1 N-acetyltransferase [Litoribacter alkaliphilus]
MEAITFKRNLDQSNSSIVAVEQEKEVGRIEFSLQSSKLTINHTEVSPEKRGGELAKTLVFKTKELSEEKNIGIESNCPYAKKVLQKEKE